MKLDSYKNIPKFLLLSINVAEWNNAKDQLEMHNETQN